jgi:hypothetical protein
MSIDRILTMIWRRLLNKAVNRGIDKGCEMIFGRDEPAGKAGPDARAAQKKARRTMRIIRRLGR